MCGRYGALTVVAWLNAFVVTISTFISNLLQALWTVLESERTGLETRGPFVWDFMEELNPKQLSVKQLKDQFLEALIANHAQKALQILHTGKLDIDTVLEVDDPSMVLASYKQGERDGMMKHCMCNNTLTAVTVSTLHAVPSHLLLHCVILSTQIAPESLETALINSRLTTRWS